MKPRDEIELNIIRSLEWLEARKRDAEHEAAGFKADLWWGSKNPNNTRFLLSEALDRIRQFSVLIGQHKSKIRAHRQKQRAQQLQQSSASDPEPLLYALPRPDVFDVKEVEALPSFAEHPLVPQIARQAATLEAWNYRCLGMRNRRPSRRYEGFPQVA